jgi:hypothetical protein
MANRLPTLRRPPRNATSYQTIGTWIISCGSSSNCLILGNSRQADDIDALRSTLVSRILQHERLPDLMILRRLTISFEEWV